jgi:thioredoxin-related protein
MSPKQKGMELLFFTSSDCPACQALKLWLSKACADFHFTLTEVDVTTQTGGQLADNWEVTVLPTLVLQEGIKHLWYHEGSIQEQKARLVWARLISPTAWPPQGSWA